MTIAEHVGMRIRERREQRGLSVAELAEKIGISQPNMTRIEKAEHGTTLDRLEKIAEVLGVEITYFFRNSKNKLPKQI